MTDKPGWWVKDEQPSLYLWVFTKMTLGAAYGALFLTGVIFFILILRVLSGLLPEDPYAALETGAQMVALLA
ncbi:RC-LH1 core complex protein PufX [Phaeobacter sp.]|uniref:RC-LH1 core complex protein PufX n=1 Tax=Phaeobacter sp. TaxID=1902409 RepID=UPI0025DBF8F7|nr:RC-LH1 core complex protein PufX [Phaeobacter sp.]